MPVAETHHGGGFYIAHFPDNGLERPGCLAVLWSPLRPINIINVRLQYRWRPEIVNGPNLS